MGIEKNLANEINQYLNDHPEENKVIFSIDNPSQIKLD